MSDLTTSTSAETSHLDEVRARLEARGLLRASTAPHDLRVPDVASPTIVLPDAGDGTVAAGAIVVAGAPLAVVPCPACRATRHVGINRTGFECAACDEAWRWAICGACDRLALTSERQESWRCRACDGLSRSWWRTTLPTDEPSRVIRRRTDQFASHAADARSAAERSGARRSLFRVTVVLALLAAATAGFVLARAAGEVEAGGACGRFDQLAGRIQSGQLQGAAAAAELRELAGAPGSTPAMKEAALAMTSAPSVMSTEFAVARTAYEDACRGG